MENIRAIQELLEDAEIPEGIYLKVCGHLKKAHDALMSKVQNRYNIPARHRDNAGDASNSIRTGVEN